MGRKHALPKYRKQRTKTGDRAFVELDGARHYLGDYGSDESHERYARLVAQWKAAGSQLSVSHDRLTITELVAQFWVYAEGYYRKPDGSPTSELNTLRCALKPLIELYGGTVADAFGPLALKAVRQRMIQLGWCRSNINKNVGRVKLLFKWATSNELVRPAVYHGLQAVSGLKRGRCDARENPPKRPVPEEHIEAVKPFVSRQVWALIQLQLHSAARGGELLNLRAIDIDTRDEVWTFRMDQHKTAHYGKERVIYFGPVAQGILAPFMADRPVDAFLFSPKEAEQERHANAKIHRRPGQLVNPKRTNREVGNVYTSASYRRAIDRACRKAAIPVWSPHRLRHSAGTLIRRQYGIEAAQVMLGHARCDTTQVYSEVSESKARAVALRIG